MSAKTIIKQIKKKTTIKKNNIKIPRTVKNTVWN